MLLTGYPSIIWNTENRYVTVINFLTFGSLLSQNFLVDRCLFLQFGQIYSSESASSSSETK